MYRIGESGLEVEKYREYLQKLMEDKKEYTGEEILSASRILDALINEYYSMKRMGTNVPSKLIQ